MNFCSVNDAPAIDEKQSYRIVNPVEVELKGSNENVPEDGVCVVDTNGDFSVVQILRVLVHARVEECSIRSRSGREKGKRKEKPQHKMYTSTLKLKNMSWL
jgi:hypothetical protein